MMHFYNEQIIKISIVWQLEAIVIQKDCGIHKLWMKMKTTIRLSVIGHSPVAFWLTHFLLFIFCLASEYDWLRYGYFKHVNVHFNKTGKMGRRVICILTAMNDSSPWIWWNCLRYKKIACSCKSYFYLFIGRLFPFFLINYNHSYYFYIVIKGSRWK